MPDLYFNPYPGEATDLPTGKRLLLRTAVAVENLRASIDQTINPEGDCPISAFSLARGDNGILLNLEKIVYSLNGQEKNIALRFFLLFAKGKKLTEEELRDHESLVLNVLCLPAPVLEYAFIKNGMTTSIATAPEWESSFLTFAGRDDALPNIYGQDSLNDIREWISEWNIRNTGYLEAFKENFNIEICKGALSIGEFSNSEWELVFQKMGEAKNRKFEHDGYLVKDVATTDKGPLKQIKQKGSGLRLYVVIFDDQILFCGTYRKGHGGSKKRENIMQSKSITKAINRINCHQN